jgi:hypothetical protein
MIMLVMICDRQRNDVIANTAEDVLRRAVATQLAVIQCR